MERKEFLSMLSTGTASMLLFTCLGGCGNSKSEDPQPSNAGNTTTPGTGGSTKKDFIIDLNTTTSLKTKGNAVVQSGVIVAYTNGGSYIAVAAACTHQGTTVDFNAANTRFVCPNHGSVFTESGAVLNGPATLNLKQYKTTLTGNNLRVFED